MTQFLNKFFKYRSFLFLIILINTPIFFVFNPVITYDTGHYFLYTKILHGYESFYKWDSVRGPIFPVIIFLIQKLFGYSNNSLLVFLYIFYFFYLLGINFLLKNFKINNVFITLFFFGLNPLIFGYFHVFLTESLVIPFLPWLILFYLRWEKKLLVNSIVFKSISIFFSIFLWHLKQPYALFNFFIIIAKFIFSKNFNYLKLLFLNIIILILSILAWNSFLKLHNNYSLGSRDSYSIIKTIYKYKTKNFLNSLNLWPALSAINFIDSYFDKKGELKTNFKINFGGGNENETIGYRFLKECNIIGGSSQIPYSEVMKIYEQCNPYAQKSFFSEFFYSTLKISNIFFTVVFIGNFLIIIFFILSKIKLFNIFLKKTFDNIIIISILVVFYWFSISYISGLDRYQIPNFSIAIVPIYYVVFVGIKKLKNHIKVNLLKIQ